LAARQLDSRREQGVAPVKLDEIVAISATLGDDGLLPEHLKKDSVGTRRRDRIRHCAITNAAQRWWRRRRSNVNRQVHELAYWHCE
jgi:hypothetical protein